MGDVSDFEAIIIGCGIADARVYPPPRFTGVKKE